MSVSETMAVAKPRVEIIALGGTIASVQGAGAGVVPTLTAADMVRTIPGIDDLAIIGAGNMANMASTEITFDLLFSLADRIAQLEKEGVAGVIVTQGTDTIEETSYVLDLLHRGNIPIVVTGAMRNPSLPGPDGPANLHAAVACAVDPKARGLGALVVFDDVIHSAAWVQKRDTSSTGAFQSPAPLGWMAEGKPAFYARGPRRPPIGVPANAVLPRVPILKPGLADGPFLLEACMSAGVDGVVLDLPGGGHAIQSWLEPLERAVARFPVVYASRTRGGRVLTRTYGFSGSEIDLLRRGLQSGGDLDAVKARLTLMLLLMADTPERFGELSDLSCGTLN